MTSRPPPDEPQFTSEASLLSPASPKPMHFPAPTNIPVLEMQTDVAFNQTDAHMSDPSMHNTEVRHDAWRDPDAPQADNAPDDVSTFPTGADPAMEGVVAHDSGRNPDAVEQKIADESLSDASQAPVPAEPMQAANAELYEASANLATAAIPEPNADTMTAEASRDTSAQSNIDVRANEPMQTHDNVHANSDETALEDASKVAANGEVDFQVLLDNIVASNPQAAPANDAPASSVLSLQTQPPPPGVPSSPTSATSLGAPPSGLPPRPPPQEQPLLHPNYVHSKHLRDYHPHAEHPAFQPQANKSGATVVSPGTNNFVPPVPAYHAPTQASPIPATPQDFHRQPEAFESRRESGAGGSRPNEDQPWTPETNKKYEKFLDTERNYVSEARWEQFPLGSRLFVGNLSSEKVTKRDIFHVFHHYGDLAQVSIKQAYGFVQFLRAEDCQAAMQNEEGRLIREKKIHLEISKPQQPRNNNRNQQSRRSRSPDHGRSAGGVDRYVSGGRNGNSRNQQERGGRRDNHRRSASPRGYNHYSGRNRNRSRSPSYSRGGGGRYRSPSPRRDVEDDLPLPKRQPRDVPDVQIIVLDELDRQFIAYVERAFSARAVRVDVLILSPRLSEAAVVRRQIVEGVLAVVKLTRNTQQTGKIPLQVFNRSQGASNVTFEEYANLDPNICVELVLREKQKQTPQSAPPAYGGGYGYGYNAQQQPPPPQQYGMPPQQPPPGSWAPPGQQQPQYSVPTAQQPPQDLSKLITNLNPNAMQGIISAIGQSPASAQQYGAPPNTAHSALTPELARMLQGQQQLAYGQAQQDPYAALRTNPALAGMLNGQQAQQAQGLPQQSTPQQPDMQEILKRLGTYNG